MSKDKKKLVFGIVYIIFGVILFLNVLLKNTILSDKVADLMIKQLVAGKVYSSEIKLLENLPSAVYGLAMIVCLVLCILIFVFKIHKGNKAIIALNILTIVTLVLGMQGINFIIVAVEGILLIITYIKEG